MLISKTLEAAINQQIGREYGAALQYVNIASYFTADNLLVFGKLFFEQSSEEIVHATKFVKYVLDAGGQIAVPAIPAGRADFQSAEDAVGAALKWEEEVTAFINELMDLAVKEKDYIAQEFLQWYEKEQLEEVNKMTTILSVVKRSKSQPLMAEAYLIHMEKMEGKAAS